MSGFEGLGRLLVFAGIFLVIAGLIFVFWSRIPYLGRLPGDIVVQKEGLSVYIPLVSSILISLALTVTVNIAIRFFNR
jgi:hypothetical protein